MYFPKPSFLHAMPTIFALMLAAAPAQAQQADQPAPSASAAAQDSSDQNVPAATARKQAAEVATGDPQRWYREDATPAARLRTMQKEIAAGLQEAQGNCKRQPTADRAACLKTARATYQKEMAEARARSAAAPAQ